MVTRLRSLKINLGKTSLNATIIIVWISIEKVKSKGAKKDHHERRIFDAVSTAIHIANLYL